jgi:hypothetical protein
MADESRGDDDAQNKKHHRHCYGGESRPEVHLIGSGLQQVIKTQSADGLLTGVEE